MGRARCLGTTRAALWSASALVLATVSAATEPPAAGVLVVEVSGVPSPGTLHLEIYAASGQERWGEPLRRERLAVERASAEWRVEALPQGEYAVRIFLDLNGNGSLDRTRSGLPSEPFGFSNDARRRFGVPRLKAAAFRFEAPEQRIAIQLQARAASKAPAAPDPSPGSAPD